VKAASSSKPSDYRGEATGLPHPNSKVMSQMDESQTKQDKAVLQVERRDYTQLAPTGRARVQSMEGFDPIYTDIVDYIVRCTHKIWDERDVGLIYTHYTHNCVLYGSLGSVQSREEVIKSTIQQLASFPDRRGMANQVIWNGNDKDGFYTSHLVTSFGRHNQPGHLGPATGRTFTTRIVADCMILQNRIYREWVIADNLGVFRQLGLDADLLARLQASSLYKRGTEELDIGETRRLVGQMPPAESADLELAHTDLERQTLTWMHEVYNKRMFGGIEQIYAPNVMLHATQMREQYGRSAVMHHTLGLVASLPDCIFIPQHICSVESEEGGTKVAVRWVLAGHHQGSGYLRGLGSPSGQYIQILGMTHFHYKNGRIVDEWVVYDEFAAMVQKYLGQFHAGAAEPILDSDFDMPID
jgi:predicted ester cyclase